MGLVRWQARWARHVLWSDKEPGSRGRLLQPEGAPEQLRLVGLPIERDRFYWPTRLRRPMERAALWPDRGPSGRPTDEPEADHEPGEVSSSHPTSRTPLALPAGKATFCRTPPSSLRCPKGTPIVRIRLLYVHRTRMCYAPPGWVRDSGTGRSRAARGILTAELLQAVQVRKQQITGGIAIDSPRSNHAPEHTTHLVRDGQGAQGDVVESGTPRPPGD